MASATMNEEWNIQSPAFACSLTQKPFARDEPVYTILSIAAEGFHRQDVSEEAWLSAGGEQIRDKAGVVSFWKRRYQPPAPPPPEPLKKEDAEGLLREMLKTNLPEEREVRYILAVMLERKRILKHRETLRGDLNVLVYEHARTAETLTIEDPHLKLHEIAAVQKRVAALLGQSLQPKPPAAAGSQPSASPGSDSQAPAPQEG